MISGQAGQEFDLVAIFGAAGSLGRAFTEAARLRATRVLLYDRMADDLTGIRKCDLASCVDVDRSVCEICEIAPFRVGIVFTAGIFDGSSPPIDVPWDRSAESLQINLNSTAQIAVESTKELLRAGARVRLIVVSSAAARVGSHDISYGVSKAGLEGLVRSLSKAFARQGLTAIGVSPGYFRSAMSAGQNDERSAAAAAASHLGRPVTVEEVVDVLEFALFDAPDAMTGAIVNVSAGQ
jgi:3-oxoacyl-[acyl-carrier protein] reductase